MTYDPFRYWNTKRLRVQGMRPISELEKMAFREWARELPAWQKMLEVGSGFGRVYEDLIYEYAEIFYSSCDISDWLAREFLRRHGKAPVQADGLALPYPDRSFDLVVSWDVMLHVPPDDLRWFISEHLRVAQRWLYVATLALDSGNLRLAPHCFVHDNKDVLDSFPGWGLHVDDSHGNRAHYYMERNGA